MGGGAPKRSPSPGDPETSPSAASNKSRRVASDATPAAPSSDTAALAPPPTMRPPSSVPRYLLRVQYDGTNFHGFQRQQNARSVQGVLEEALAKFAGASETPVRTVGSSRTDAGVHALDATAHVDLARTSKRRPGEILTPHPASTVMHAVNHFLKRAAPDAHVHECVRVDPERFHARYCATARTYHYRVRVSRNPPDVFERGRVWHVARGHPEVSALMPDEVLNVTAMRAAAERLTGKAIDFSAFRASGCQAKSPIRELTALVVEGADPHAAVHVPDPPGVRTIAHETAEDHLDDVRVEETVDAAEMNDADASARWSRDASATSTSSSSTSSSYGYGAWFRSNGAGGSGTSSAYFRGGDLRVVAHAPAFLYHQVRLMVATLVAVGKGELEPEDVTRLLEGRDSTAVPAMAPAHGLCLTRVHYDGTRKWSPNAPNEAGEDE